MIIEATALKIILFDIVHQKQFLKIAKIMETVICCRVSPEEKAKVVRLIKKDDPEIITLAIGDGANDVSMILEADIGIGLFGKEGNRAVDSSDFAIAEFRFLWHLILKHGRWNYIRMGFLINYYFYKNMIYTLMQEAFCFFNGFSLQTASLTCFCQHLKWFLLQLQLQHMEYGTKM